LRKCRPNGRSGAQRAAADIVRAYRRVASFASAAQVKLILVSALLFVAACTATNGQAHRGTETILYAPRPLGVIQDPTPYYPDASKRRTETGEVILHFRIGADGIAQEPFVVDDASTATPRLIDTAKKLFLRSRYEIGERYRHEVTASVLFEIMPCGKLQQTSGLDYYYNLCIPPLRPVPAPPNF
jgi:hypothetical protein